MKLVHLDLVDFGFGSVKRVAASGGHSAAISRSPLASRYRTLP